ncbi:MAG: hypothetical protein Q9176_001373 [Flavoplaca citrina]
MAGSLNAQVDSIETPSRKRRRTTRCTASGKSMNYDQKYHPMDDYTRPSAAAARRAVHGLLEMPRPSSTSSESATLNNDPEDSSDESSEAEVVEKSIHRPIRIRSGSPSTRRVTRGEVNGERIVQYNTKHHPMDDIIRPKQARKVLARTAALAHASASAASPKVIQQPDQPDQHTGWKSLTHQDRLLFSLQKGAHPSDSTIPMSWTRVAEALNVPATSSTTTRLQHQYADVYQHMRTYYAAADEPAAKYHQTLYHAEGFDLYNHSAGNKYWHHRNDNIVSHDAPAQTDSPAIGTTNEKTIATTDAASGKFDDHGDEDKENYNPQRNGLDTAPASMHQISEIQITEGQSTTALNGVPGLSYRAAAGVGILPPKDSGVQQSHRSTTLSEKRISNGSTSTLPRFDDDEPVDFDARAYEEDGRRLMCSSPG